LREAVECGDAAVTIKKMPFPRKLGVVTPDEEGSTRRANLQFVLAFV
jgi:hypothetical protein